MAALCALSSPLRRTRKGWVVRAQSPWGPVRCQRRDADDARVQGDSPSMHDACRTPAAAANDLDGLTWARLRTRKRFSWAPPLGNVPVTPYVARLPFRHRSGACTAGSPLIEMPRRRQDRWEPAHTGHHDVCGRELLCVTPADCAFAPLHCAQSCRSDGRDDHARGSCAIASPHAPSTGGASWPSCQRSPSPTATRLAPAPASPAIASVAPP